MRKLYLDCYAERNRKSLHHRADTGELYVCRVHHLDKVFGYGEDGDRGSKVAAITCAVIQEFKTKRQAEGASYTGRRDFAEVRTNAFFCGFVPRNSFTLRTWISIRH